MSSEEDRATDTGNTHKKFGEVQPHGFRVIIAERHIDILITIFHNHNVESNHMLHNFTLSQLMSQGY